MRAIYWAGILVIAALVSVFAASNRETVALGLWPLPFLAQAPLYLVVLVALFFGFATGAVAAWIKGRRRRRQLRACRRQNEALARELAATQSQLADSAQTTRTALPPTRQR
ncbi:MAG TPA: lipopolysaccharide assembly protein LapA domain-containing protein [Stellaceae bacterium]|nr:lipopolysaccharide assembly protein LapA domain-containing protein [Stellaceae bacterium]